MLEKIATWLLTFLLDYLRKKATQAVQEIIEERKTEESRGELNEENAKKYEEAKDRKERIDAALDLLNRS